MEKYFRRECKRNRPTGAKSKKCFYAKFLPPNFSKQFLKLEQGGRRGRATNGTSCCRRHCCCCNRCHCNHCCCGGGGVAVVVVAVLPLKQIYSFKFLLSALHKTHISQSDKHRYFDSRRRRRQICFPQKSCGRCDRRSRTARRPTGQVSQMFSPRQSQ